MSFRKHVPFLVFLVLFSFSQSPLYALKVKQIDPASGVLTLEDGRTARLAGLELSPEAPKVLSIILSKHEIQYDEEKQPSSDPVMPVYISFKASSIDFPFKVNADAKESKVSLNELLLIHGFARVDLSQDFSKKETFLKIEEEARRLGKGIWSEEPDFKKRS